MNNDIVTKQMNKIVPEILVLDEAFYIEYGITRIDLCSRNRTKRFSMLRGLYITLISKVAPILTCVEIAKLVNRDHSTVLWYQKQCVGWLKYDKAFKEMYERISNKYKQLKKEKENELD